MFKISLSSSKTEAESWKINMIGSSFAAPQSNACILGFRAMGQKLWETVEGIVTWSTKALMIPL